MEEQARKLKRPNPKPSETKSKLATLSAQHTDHTREGRARSSSSTVDMGQHNHFGKAKGKHISGKGQRRIV
ncbi:hypothetical protein ERO13_A09G076120v2 [Gossypium hirsutum]|uniref:Uncharacterized protein n=2 Tax=Gossypium TaxID=3633 RepID=A0A5J5UCG2_GOSBA|nr:hypothetical protein ES319_A09G079800v1 [Gossypium barbadense]KAG4182916.1 hypothetical protein ERO13_A09G076120v2 [Gossypium hirsutum]TYJ17867.1 hypothetical protein E1A91_A09G083400v1 [Gossypium mustelinum]